MMNWIINKLTGGDKFAQEAFDRWVMPEVQRAREAGISETEIDRIVKQALRESNPAMGGPYPGAVLRGLVDEAIEAKQS